MPSELLNGNSSPRRDRSLVIAYWVVGLVAVAELIIAAIGLAPKLATTIRKSEPLQTSTPSASPAPTEVVAERALILQQLANPSSVTAATPPRAPLSTKAPKSPKTEEPVSGAAEDQTVDHPDLSSDASTTIESTDRPFRQPPPDAASPQGAAIEILTADLKGADDGSKTLQLAIKSRSHDLIDVPQVKVQVYFYDEQNGEIFPSKAQVTSRWLSAPVNWEGGKPELLEVRYLSDTADPDVHFSGYVVAIYYKGDLQDCRANPPKLQKLFEPRFFLPSEELQ